jgi:biopolymer transport protein ExbB
MENTTTESALQGSNVLDRATDAASLFAGQGGMVLYILAGMSVLVLTLILYKILQFTILKVQASRESRALALWQQGERDQARALVVNKSAPVSRLMAGAMTARRNGIPRSAIEEILEIEAAREIEGLRQFLRAIELVAITAPLLGLLGTVLGMIEAFRALEEAGSRVDPSILSGGIWVALLTTAAGLVVAIPAATFHSLFEGAVEKIVSRMEQSVTLVLSGTGQARAGENRP